MTEFTEEGQTMLRLLAVERQEIEIRLEAIRRQKRKATDDIAPIIAKSRDISGPSLTVARKPVSSVPWVIDLGSSDAESVEQDTNPTKAQSGNSVPMTGGDKTVHSEPQTVNPPYIIDLGSEDDDDDNDDASGSNSVAHTMSVVDTIRRNPTRQPRNRQPLVITKGGDLPRSLNFSQQFPEVPSPGMHTYAYTPEHWRALRAMHPKFGSAQWGLEIVGKATWPADTFLAGDFRKVDVCLPGRVTAYDDPNSIQSCREIVWVLYTIYTDGLTPWDPLKDESIYAKNPQLKDTDRCVFDSCPYIELQQNGSPPSWEVSYECHFCNRIEKNDTEQKHDAVIELWAHNPHEWVAVSHMPHRKILHGMGR